MFNGQQVVGKLISLK